MELSPEKGVHQFALSVDLDCLRRIRREVFESHYPFATFDEDNEVLNSPSVERTNTNRATIILSLIAR